MPIQNSAQRYGSIAKFFHWLTALLMLTVFPLGLVASNLSHSILSAEFDGSAETIARAVLLFSIHKTLGVTIFFVAIARILWALTQPKPGLLHPENKPEAFAAETVHWLLYGAMLIAPLSGWIHHAATTGFAPIWWPFGQDLPFVPKSEGLAALFGTLHWLAVFTLLGAFGLHVAGALKHAVIDRDATLQRMLPGNSDLPAPRAQKHAILPAFAALAIWVAVLGAGSQLLGSNHDHASDHSQADAAVAVQQEGATAETDSTWATEPAQNDAATLASNWRVENGSISITIQQMGSAVTGQFNSWDAQIQFEEPTAPGPAGRVDVEIDITSLSLGSVTDQAMGADYFDSASFPTARFQAELSKGTSGYEAVGTLTLRGKSLPLSFLFDLQLNGDKATMQAQASVNRMDFDIGLGTKDEGSLGYEVVIVVALDAVNTGD
ncbi:cytochrome b/b6 domain-containing protein [Roseobacter sp. SK209-2-6]|uniref:cytochrome b/b6 domain-containing protein n=1 Tax=Roseobacter sp. SK209-2-6 TaxID=388739 RepID=UPI00030C72A6|nr:cytochrome b/b6 domain-containing protein [Roseobacter sp. SK209-2-6]